MPQVEVFEPAMCCSTGICGPSVDPVLVRFAADVEWLKGKGVTVQRRNLSQQPQSFVTNATVRDALAERGVDILPLVIVNGKIVLEGRYPTRRELAGYVGLQGDVAQSDVEERPLFRPKGGCC